ncbi:hypothetical protein PHJA_001497100, partial [Phtheirospermum japonicum]
ALFISAQTFIPIASKSQFQHFRLTPIAKPSSGNPPVLSWPLSGDLQFISTAGGQRLDETSVSLSKILSVHGYCRWAAASTAKLGLGISTIRRGHAGESTFMPLKAFSVASLFCQRRRLRRHGIPSFFRPPICKIFMLLFCFWCKESQFYCLREILFQIVYNEMHM